MTEKGRVVEHADEVELQDVRFCVGPKGRARVLREKVKNVHARLRGLRARPTLRSVRGWTRVGYDPYRWASFVALSSERAVVGAEIVIGRVHKGRAQVWARGLQYA